MGWGADVWKKQRNNKTKRRFKVTKVVGLKERPKKEKIVMQRNTQRKHKETNTVYSFVAGLGTYTDGQK